MKIYICVPNILNNGGIKVAAQWTKFLCDHGYDAILANGPGNPCMGYWNFTVPTCSFAQIEDHPENKIVHNWGPDILQTQRLHLSQIYYYAQDCAQPYYPLNEQYMPLMLKMRFITIGHHSHFYYLYNYKVQSKMVNNFVDQEVFYPREKIKNRVCFLKHREHYIEGIEKSFESLGFSTVVACGTQQEVAEILGTAEYFVSFAPGIYDGYEKSEGFPLPPAEAMSSGCVVFCMDSNGINEYVLNRVNAIYHGGGFNDAATKLLEIKDNEPYKRWLSDNAFNTFKYRFNKENTWNQIKAALDL